jgi:SAM-dependent methyltransferase
MPAPSHDPWETVHAPRLLDRLGVRAGMCVVDGGCREGRYTTALARRVTNKGMALGVDTNRQVLAQLAARARGERLPQLRTLCADLNAGLGLRDETVDSFLLYDVLHCMHVVEREALYRKVAAALRHRGILSVHIAHYGDQSNARMLKGMSPEDVFGEIENCGLVLRDRYEGTLSHGDGLMEGCVASFGLRT